MGLPKKGKRTENKHKTNTHFGEQKTTFRGWQKQKKNVWTQKERSYALPVHTDAANDVTPSEVAGIFILVVLGEGPARERHQN